MICELSVVGLEDPSQQAHERPAGATVSRGAVAGVPSGAQRFLQVRIHVAHDEQPEHRPGKRNVPSLRHVEEWRRATPHKTDEHILRLASLATVQGERLNVEPIQVPLLPKVIDGISQQFLPYPQPPRTVSLGSMWSFGLKRSVYARRSRGTNLRHRTGPGLLTYQLCSRYPPPQYAHPQQPFPDLRRPASGGGGAVLLLQLPLVGECMCLLCASFLG